MIRFLILLAFLAVSGTASADTLVDVQMAAIKFCLEKTGKPSESWTQGQWNVFYSCRNEKFYEWISYYPNVELIDRQPELMSCETIFKDGKAQTDCLR